MKLTIEQGIILTGFTGIVCCNFGDFHAAVEKKLGRPVWTHEMGTDAMSKQIKEAFREDFISIMPDGVK